MKIISTYQEDSRSIWHLVVVFRTLAVVHWSYSGGAATVNAYSMTDMEKLYPLQLSYLAEKTEDQQCSK